MAKTNTRDNVRTRIKLFAIPLILLGMGLLVRLLFVQVINYEYYMTRAKSRVSSSRRIEGKRGEIFDRGGNLLVSNVPCVHITATPAHFKPVGKAKLDEKLERDRVKLSFLLSRYLGKDSGEFYRRLEPTREVINDDSTVSVIDRKYVVLGKYVPLETANKLREQAKVNGLWRYLHYEDTYVRSYPKGKLLSNVIGYTNIEDEKTVAQLGIERHFDRQISGHDGKESFEHDRYGRPLSYGEHHSTASRDGWDIFLTISEPIQSILEEELDKGFEKWHPHAIYAIIADPQGNILAMAQRPTFDPNDRSTFEVEGANSTLIAINQMEPGSIMKPFTIAKALDWGYVTPDTPIDCEKGRWYYGGKVLTDSHKYDILTVGGVIQKSSNIGTAKVALLMGDEKVQQALRLFKFGQKTNLPLPAEVSGQFPAPPMWRRDKLLLTRVPIGYASAATPLQLVRAYCALANGGKMPTLRMVDHLRNPENGEIAVIRQPEAEQLFEHPQALKQLIEMMTTVTKPGGTAAAAAIPGFEVAGKTGTSRKYIARTRDKDGKFTDAPFGYVHGKYFSSFVGFVPADDPKLVMMVTFDEPHGAYYASTVAAPVFKATASRVLRYMNIYPPEEQKDE